MCLGMNKLNFLTTIIQGFRKLPLKKSDIFFGGAKQKEKHPQRVLFFLVAGRTCVLRSPGYETGERSSLEVKRPPQSTSHEREAEPPTVATCDRRGAEGDNPEVVRFKSHPRNQGVRTI